jgi:large subunit ribosomal protein L23
MNQERLMKVILSPLVSEKSTTVADKHNQVVFKVLPDANKNEIKSAVELLFKVEVASVRVCNMKGKKKVFKQKLGQRKNWKKAYVALKEGHDINFVGAE